MTTISQWVRIKSTGVCVEIPADQKQDPTGYLMRMQDENRLKDHGEWEWIDVMSVNPTKCVPLYLVHQTEQRVARIQRAAAMGGVLAGRKAFMSEIASILKA